MKKFIVILILLISNFSYYGAVQEREKRKDTIQELVQEENVIQNEVIMQKQEDIISQKDITTEVEKTKIEEKALNDNATKKDTSTKSKVQASNSDKTNTQTVIQTNKETKDSNNHQSDIRQETNTNTNINIDNSPKCEHGNNGWYNTEAEAVAVYKTKLKYWEDKWANYEIEYDEFLQSRPNGYETWDCPYCYKWTINMY